MSDLLLARSTVNLPKLAVGREAWVDRDDPYIAGLLDAGWLVPVDERQQPPVLTSGEMGSDDA